MILALIAVAFIIGFISGAAFILRVKDDEGNIIILSRIDIDGRQQ